MADNRIAGRFPTVPEGRDLYNHARLLRAEALRDCSSRIARAVARGARGLASTGRSLLLAFGEALAAKRTHDELSRLTDRELKDLGIARNEIAAVAWGASRGIDERPVNTAATAATAAPAREETAPAREEAAAPAREEVAVEYRKAA